MPATPCQRRFPGLDDEHRPLLVDHARRDLQIAVRHGDHGAGAPVGHALRVAGDARGGGLVDGRQGGLRVQDELAAAKPRETFRRCLKSAFLLAKGEAQMRPPVARFSVEA